MRKGKNLFLFTNAFPTSFSQENYLIEEIAYLGKAFDKVLIIPLEKESVKHALPANVTVDWLDTEVPLGFMTKLSFLVSNMTLIVKELMTFKYAIKDLKVLIQELLIAKFYANGIVKLLDNYELSTKNTFFYTYWCNTLTLSLALLKRKDPDIVFISRGHQADVYIQPNQKLKTSYYGTKLKALNKLFIISDHGSNYLKTTYPSFSSKISRSYLGVRDRGENPLNKNGEFTIVSVSKLGDNKRVFAIPEILNHLDFNIKWVHFGWSDPQDVEKVRKAAANLRNNVVFEMMGMRPNSEIMEYYGKHTVNLFINVSVIEGLSFAAIEALSFGIPLLITNTNAAGELVKGNGYVIPIDYEPEKVAGLINLIRNSGEAELRKNSRALFLEHFNASKNYNEFIKHIA